MKSQILYLFDPLCGWCYGFSQTMLDFYHQQKENFEFVAIPGGMITGNRIAPYHSMESFILNSYRQIEEMSGARFGEKYLQELITSDAELNSEPPSRALITFRSFDYDRAVPYAHALQNAHFAEGKDYNQEVLYTELAAGFGLDPEAFRERYHDERIKTNVQQEFAWVSESGVQGFPTVVLRAGRKYYMLAHGYASIGSLHQSLGKATQMIRPV